MILERVSRILELCDGPTKNIPPTDLYNEGWMLRLVLDWFANHSEIVHELAILKSERWYSEALLPSQFLPRHRGDHLAESWTHADGVIGDFLIGESGEGDLTLSAKASKIVVTEAKMFSKLSSGVKNASYYNQAARNVACIAEVIKRAHIKPDSMKNIGFFVIAPRSRIKEGVFAANMSRDSIKTTVERRISEYDDPQKTTWFQEWFIPALDLIMVREISWEELIEFITHELASDGIEMQNFYQKCLQYNQYVGEKYAF